MWTNEFPDIAGGAVDDLEAAVDRLRTWDDAAMRYQVRLDLLSTDGAANHVSIPART